MNKRFPPALQLLLRATGLFVSVSLLLSPWALAVDVSDPFLNQSWILLGLGLLASCVFGVLLLFFRPRSGSWPYAFPAFLCWLALALATLSSSYLRCWRVALLQGTHLLLLALLRYTRERRDNWSLIRLYLLNSTAMALFGVAQYFGFNLIEFIDSPHRVVGTFSNPNFFSAFLLPGTLLTFGLCWHSQNTSPSEKLLYGCSCFVHVVAIWLSNSLGAMVCLLGGAIFLGLPFSSHRTSFWPLRQQVLAGTGLCAFFLVAYGLNSLMIRFFPWETLVSPPEAYFSLLSRLFAWDMGFSLFLRHPLLGAGPGSSHFLLTAERAPLANAMRLSLFNDDAHSFPLTLLGETGLFGLISACALFLVGLKLHGRFRVRHSTAILDTVAPSSVVSHGTEAEFTIPLATGIIALLVHGLGNSTLNLLPLSMLLLLLVSFHQTACLQDVRWQRKNSILSVVYLGFAVLYGVGGYQLNITEQYVSTARFWGEQALAQNQAQTAAGYFRQALSYDPQSIHSIWGLAQATEKQNKPARTQEILASLDQLAPHAFGCRFRRASLLLQMNMILEAHRFALQSLAWSRSPITYELLGNILLLEGRVSEAAMIFAEGLSVPHFRHLEILAADRIRTQLAIYAISHGNIEQAEQLLMKMSASSGKTARARFLRGQILAARDDFSAALEHFTQALAQDPNNPSYQNAVGYTLVSLNLDLERAETLLQRSYAGFKAKQPPMLRDILSVVHSQGILYWRLGDFNKAEQLLETAYTETLPEWSDLKHQRYTDLMAFFKDTGRVVPPALSEP